MSDVSCSPTVAVSASYPHHLELACWEHGSIADLGYTPSAANIAWHVNKHLTDLGQRDEQVGRV